MAFNNPEHLPLNIRLVSNNGTPLRNAEYATLVNLPTRTERRAALRQYKKTLKKHVQFKLKQGIKVPNAT